jgi:hypothetical protein
LHLEPLTHLEDLCPLIQLVEHTNERSLYLQGGVQEACVNGKGYAVSMEEREMEGEREVGGVGGVGGGGGD